jgi:hypothetical protein
MRRFLLAAAIMTTASMLPPSQSDAATRGSFETLQAAAKETHVVEPAACVRRQVCNRRGCAWRTVCGRRW